jgi:type VI secretion system protein VasJ
MDVELTRLASEPISADAPQGISARYEPEYQEIQTEIAKLQSVSAEKGSNAVNWGRVQTLSQEILGKKSKDMLVASYLCMALFERQGLAGLQTGLTIFHELMTNFWDTLFPELKRIKGRVAAIQWLSETAAKQVVTKNYSSSDHEILEQTRQKVEKIHGLLNDLLQEEKKVEEGCLAELNRELKNKLRSLSAPPPAQTSVETASPSTPSAATTPTPSKIESEADAQRALRDTKTTILKAAGFLRTQNPENPLPYRLARSMLWDTVEAPPPNTDGRTQIPGIAPHLKESRQQLLQSADPEMILNQTEIAFVTTPFWLDLQRQVDEALTELGEPYRAVQTVIREELGTLLRRCPDLMNLAFQDEMAFADPETNDWIRKVVLDAQAGAADPAFSGQAASSQSELDGVFNEARQLARQKKMKEAIALFQKKLATLPHRRDRFIWNLHLAKICMLGQHHELALAQLESLDREIDLFSLEEWEPQLCQDVITHLIRCYQQVIKSTRQTTPENAERISRLTARLCRLNPLSALAVNGKK